MLSRLAAIPENGDDHAVAPPKGGRASHSHRITVDPLGDQTNERWLLACDNILSDSCGKVNDLSIGTVGPAAAIDELAGPLLRYENPRDCGASIFVEQDGQAMAGVWQKRAGGPRGRHCGAERLLKRNGGGALMYLRLPLAQVRVFITVPPFVTSGSRPALASCCQDVATNQTRRELSATSKATGRPTHPR